jgi:formylglycine-generating enzyme required for sulfatase activity
MNVRATIGVLLAETLHGSHAVAAETLVDGAGLSLVRIPAGAFTMGSPAGEKGRRDDEPQRRVRISQDFYLGRYEVTRGQFARFVEETKYATDAERGIRGGYGVDPTTKALVGPDKRFSWRYVGFEQADEHPVVNVSWNDAAAFCDWLGKREGAVYRLPTEAEWEYSCRAGATSAYTNGDDSERIVEVGNIVDAEAHAIYPERAAVKSSDGFVFTAPVGRYKPNAFGLHDMHGNVWEWTADRHGPITQTAGEMELVDPRGPTEGRDRVIRGGDWYHDWSFARSAQRFPIYPGLCRRHGGFRVVREIAN